MRFSITASLLLAAMQVAAAVKIMPLGDSITGSPGCWRALLYNNLITSGQQNIDMVGTLPTQGCGVAHDGDNEGHGGFLATNVADQNQLVGWLSATKPDIVMMHFATNDVWSNKSPAVITTAYNKLVDQMRASNANMKILVAKIIPMGTTQCAECGQRVIQFNNALPAWAATKSTSNSPITIVDQWTGFNTATDTYDGVHPNSAGDQKIAQRWFAPLVTAIALANGGNPTGTTTTTTTPPTTTPRTTTTTSTTTSTAPTTTSTGGTGVSPAWGQCGGIGWKGPTTCVSGYTCKVGNPYYSQCLPN